MDTAPKMQDRAKFPAVLLTSQIKKAAKPDPTMLRTKFDSSLSLKSAELESAIYLERTSVLVCPCEKLSICWLEGALLQR